MVQTDKIPLSELARLDKRALSLYLESITQTDICKDENYCKELLKIFLKS
jgi:hypothetical protein